MFLTCEKESKKLQYILKLFQLFSKGSISAIITHLSCYLFHQQAVQGRYHLFQWLTVLVATFLLCPLAELLLPVKKTPNLYSRHQSPQVDGPHHPPVTTGYVSNMVTYCFVPARWGLQQTTLAPGSDETRAKDPLVR